jgi:SAM-dependent methyltransferase
MSEVRKGSAPDQFAAFERYLACPRCRGPIAAASLNCRSCNFHFGDFDGVLSAFESARPSYFDDKHEIMSEVSGDPGTWSLFYARQAKRFEALVPPGAVVLDVGCGPQVPYTRGSDWFLIGLEPSLNSLCANRSLDLRLHGSSESIPLADKSVDAIVCFYSIHHMTGDAVPDNRRIVGKTLQEFARVMRPGGQLLVFDISPWWPFSQLELWSWNLARKTLGPRLDMFFWKATWLTAAGKAAFPAASLDIERFRSNPLIPFAPIFYLPRLKIPRMLYPFTINMYRWRF